MTPESESAEPRSALGDFYVEETCCTSCGVPQSIAPDLVGLINKNNLQQCYWIKQPQTADELDRAIQIIHAQELGCHRYSGHDPKILRRLPAAECDHFRPDLKSSYMRASGPAPRFSLPTSGKSNSVLSKLWGKLFRK